MLIKIDEKEIVLDSRAMGIWCQLPYPNHPKGCPNYGKRITCPPFSEHFKNIVDQPFFLVIQNFDLESHAKRMKKHHPEWSDRQCRNLLYWQKKVVKQLKEEAKKFIDSQDDDLDLLETPEANGVDVFKTCKNIGIILKRNPKKIVWKVMIIGRKIDNNSLRK